MMHEKLEAVLAKRGSSWVMHWRRGSSLTGIPASYYAHS